MKGSPTNTALRVRYNGKTPYIETREIDLRAGRIMVMKTPILPPGASDKAIRAASSVEVFWGLPLNCKALSSAPKFTGCVLDVGRTRDFRFVKKNSR